MTSAGRRRAQLRRVLHVRRDRGRHRREDEALQVLLVLQRVLDSEHAAPGVPEEVEVLEPQRRAHLLDLLPESVDRPEARVVRLVGVGRAELVVVIELDPLLRQEILETLEVLVRRAGPAVEGQHLDPARAHLLGPDLVFAAVDRDEPDSSGLDFHGFPRGRLARRGDRAGRLRPDRETRQRRRAHPEEPAPIQPAHEDSSSLCDRPDPTRARAPRPRKRPSFR